MTCKCWVSAGSLSAVHISLQMGDGCFPSMEPNSLVTTELLVLPSAWDPFPRSWHCSVEELRQPPHVKMSSSDSPRRECVHFLLICNEMVSFYAPIFTPGKTQGQVGWGSG